MTLAVRTLVNPWSGLVRCVTQTFSFYRGVPGLLGRSALNELNDCHVDYRNSEGPDKTEYYATVEGLVLRNEPQKEECDRKPDDVECDQVGGFRDPEEHKTFSQLTGWDVFNMPTEA